MAEPVSDRIERPARLDRARCAVLLVDMQERLVPAMREADRLVTRADRLLDAAGLLEVPVLATEQYPKGLGATVPALAGHLERAVCVEAKTRLSAAIDPVRGHLRRLGAQSVVLAGIEAHVCVLATGLDLLAEGYRVFPVWDAIGSRSAGDYEAARERLTQAGAVPGTLESVLFEWLGDAADPRFKAVQALIRDPGPG